MYIRHLPIEIFELLNLPFNYSNLPPSQHTGYPCKECVSVIHRGINIADQLTAAYHWH